jgi:1,4-alpha-glucan branching enzyme
MNVMPALVSAGRWWEGAAGYEIYVPSFADGNGDGLGDLTGICARLDYLAWLGIDLIWLTPFYLSPLADHVTTSPATAVSIRGSVTKRPLAR